jgi:hypothetical protein
MSNTKQQCNWLTLLPEVIIGAEDDATGTEGDQKTSESSSSDSSKDNKASTGSASKDSSEATNDDGHDDANDPKVIGLKTALETERSTRKAQDKELAKLRREKEERELAEKTEVEQAQIKADKAVARADKLAAGLLDRDLNDAIRTAAEAFIDPTDAIEGVDRKKLVFEQDPDDPSNITIDKKSVERAVKDLATRKPHFLKQGTEDGEPSGSTFGGNQRKKKTADETYKERYPSL